MIKMIVDKEEDVPVIHLKEKYTTAKKTIKFNVCYSLGNYLRVLFVSPDYSNPNDEDGLAMGAMKDGSIPFFLDKDRDAAFITLIRKLEERVEEAIKRDGKEFKLDVPCISTYNKDGEDRMAMWTDLIRKSDGSKTFSKFYDRNGEPMEIPTSGIATARPCFMFRVSYSANKKVHKLRASISEVCIMRTSDIQGNRMVPKKK